ncbi:hypothetical protein A7975_10780 [Bacillus sp. FJAT-26390]|nr:hypothetical protein A7975_10780 [Bacillus sp. FJAT-26390]
MVRAGADFSAMRRELRRATSDLDKFKIGMKASLAGLATVLAGIGLGGVFADASEDAIKFEALMGTISNTLGNSMNDFKKWQNTVGDAMGFSKLEVAGMANNYSLRLKSIAKTDQDLLQKTMSLIKAAAIIRSKTGMSSIEISDRMRSAMNQEADGADELGVNVRVAAIMQSKAYKELANNQPWDSMSEGMKKTILYHHILDSVTNNFGTEIAKNTALLKGGFVAALADVKLALGEAFLPILNTVLPLLTTMARAVEAVFKQVSAFMRGLFGMKVEAGVAPAVIDSVDGLGDSYEKAGKKAKKAASNLQGFDEVHTLQEDSGSDDKESAGSAGDIGGPNVMGADPGGINTVLDAAAKKAEEVAKRMREAFKDLFKEADKKRAVDAINEVKRSFESLKEAIGGLKGNKAVEGFLGNIIKLFKDATVSQFAGFMTFLSGQIDMVAGALKLLDGILRGDFKKAFQGVELIAEGFYDTLNGIAYMLLPAFGDAMKKLKEDFTKVWQQFKADVKAYGDPTKVEVSDFADYIKDKITSRMKETKDNTNENWEAMRSNINEVWEGIKTGVKWDSIKEVVSNVWGAIKTKTSEEWESIKTTVSGIWDSFLTFVKWDGIKTVTANTWASIKTSTTTAWRDIVQSVSDKWNTFATAVSWDSMLNMVANTWNGVKEATRVEWESIKATVSELWNGIVSFDFSGIIETVMNVWRNLKEGTKDMWKGITSAVETAANSFATVIKKPLNDVIDMVNKVLESISSLSTIKLPKALGGGEVGIKLPTLPKLARGGITKGTTNMGNFIAGEAGSELVMPLENTSFVDKVASALGTAVMTAITMGQGQNRGEGSNIYLDGVALARASAKYTSNESSRLGGSMIKTT